MRDFRGGAALDFLSLFVDIFFVISGFVISSIYSTRIGSSRDYLNFMQKRLARIAPLHWATLLFFAAIGGGLMLIGRPSNFPDMYDWHCFTPNLLLLHAFGTCQPKAFNYPSWSISAEMAMYLVFPAFMVLGRQKRSSLIGISVVTLVAMYIVSGGPNGDEAAGWTNWTTDFGVVRGIAGFSLGVAIYAYHDSLRQVRAALPLMLLSLAGFIALGVVGVAPMWLAPLAYATAFFAIANDLGGESRRTIRILAPLGQLTYSTYMLHAPVRLIVVVLIGEHLLHLSGTSYLYWTILSGFLVLPVAWVSLVLFERPTRRWIGALGRSARSGPIVATEPEAIDGGLTPKLSG